MFRERQAQAKNCTHLGDTQLGDKVSPASAKHQNPQTCRDGRTNQESNTDSKAWIQAERYVPQQKLQDEKVQKDQVNSRFHDVNLVSAEIDQKFHFNISSPKTLPP